MTGAKIIAGKKSATLILVIPIKFVPIMMIKIEPVQVISFIAPTLINGEMSPARRTSPPCITKTDPGNRVGFLVICKEKLPIGAGLLSRWIRRRRNRCGNVPVRRNSCPARWPRRPLSTAGCRKLRRKLLPGAGQGTDKMRPPAWDIPDPWPKACHRLFAVALRTGRS